jgi:hypothetical protein
MNAELNIARVILYCAAALISLGGLYDVLVPRLPAKLLAMCDGNERAVNLARELLRALGGSLMAVGVTVALLVSRLESENRSSTLALILVLVLPAEGMNSFSMYRAGSPFLIPLAFIVLTIGGVVLAWPGMVS